LSTASRPPSRPQIRYMMGYTPLNFYRAEVKTYDQGYDD
jgi:hypothetical protein